MSPRQILLGTALLLLLGGLILGFLPRSVEGTSESVDCGSVFQPVGDAGDIADRITGSDLGGECDSKLDDSKPFLFGALGLAGVAFIVSLVASPSPMGSKPNI